MMQLSLFDISRDPFRCPHAAGEICSKTVCNLNGAEAATNCRESVGGDPPKCVYEPIDNSPAAMERRISAMGRAFRPQQGQCPLCDA